RGLYTDYKMQTEEGKLTELYVPRQCSATNRLVTAKEHTSVKTSLAMWIRMVLHSSIFQFRPPWFHPNTGVCRLSIYYV
ncbi:40S ribosomal protein S21-2-like, partial [Trifolium medium]|nr:40S ribosomal protein S21-2-like [Trifolium medium]